MRGIDMREGHSSVLKKGLIIVILVAILLLIWVSVAYAYINFYSGFLLSIISITAQMYSLHHEKKKEKIELIKERLEKFYSPYHHNMDIIYRLPQWRLDMKERESDLSIVNEISNSIYLVSSAETRRVVEEYLQAVKKINDKSKINEEFKDLAKRADEHVDREYNQLLDELNELERK